MNRLIISVLTAIGLLCPLQAFAAYAHFRAITLEQEQVPSTLTDFTVLICANGSAPCDTAVAGLNQSGGGAHVTQADGDDIVFGTTNTCGTLLNWEMSRYVAATGEIIAWVKIASLDGSTDTTIYMCYGDSGVTTFQGGSLGTAWDSAYKGVWHLGDGASLSGVASTSSAWDLNLVNTPTATTGKIDGGANLVAASTQYMAADGSGTGVTLGTNNFTFSAWVYSATLSSGRHAVIVKEVENQRGELFFYDGHLYARGGDVNFTLDATPPSNNNWHLVAATLNGTTGAIYIDGAVAAGPSTLDAVTDGSSNLSIGISGVSNYPFDGKIDEPRVSNVARSADWIATEYNNQNAPQTFATFGTEDGGGSVIRATSNQLLLGVQ